MLQKQKFYLLPLEVSLKEAGSVEERLLEELHIQPQWLRRYPQELSGGELQRFCIARALGRATRYLLCDEITAMLAGGAARPGSVLFLHS